MNQPISERVRWTTADLELFPDNGNRYEIIDGELFVTRARHWNHQKACARIIAPLDTWSQATSLGQVVPAPGVIFGENDNVIPDVVSILLGLCIFNSALDLGKRLMVRQAHQPGKG